MNLTNAMRSELAIKLTVQAMAKHSAGLGRLAKLVADGFRHRHVKLLEEAVPEVPVERWAELIQQHIVNAANGSECGVLVTDETGKQSRGEIRSSRLVEFGRTNAEEQRCEAFTRLRVGLKQAHSGYRAALTLFCTHSLQRNCATLLLSLDSVPDLPHIPRRALLDPAQPGQALLLKNANALIARLGKILTQGFEYLEEVQTLLAGIRTDKQLQDLLPEAVKLLPPPPAPRSNIVPVELAQRVRKMLVDGVPED